MTKKTDKPKKDKHPGGRPSKKDLLLVKSLGEARQIKFPVIYGICGGDCKIVYVGQTKDLYHRFEHYKYYPHNENLKEWMATNPNWFMAILEKKPCDINYAERYWIDFYGIENLFNMVHGGEQVWRHHNRKAWMAKTGVMCPSDILLNHLNNREHPRYKQIKSEISFIRSKMSDIQRSCYEFLLYYDYKNRFRQQMTNWFEICKPRLMETIP